MSIKGEYNNILVGVDSSENANIAFTEAVQIAKRNQAKLYVAHIINDVMGYLTDDAISILRDEAEELFTNLKEQAKNSGFTDIETINTVGSPKKLIGKEFPETYQLDLLVLGATGKHRLEQSVIGSLPQYATLETPCNVLIVKP